MKVKTSKNKITLTFFKVTSKKNFVRNTEKLEKREELVLDNIKLIFHHMEQKFCLH